MGILKEFMEFLNEYKVMGLAVAFIIGVALTNLVQSLVNNIIMPLMNPFMSSGAWQEAKLSIGTITMGIGAFAGAVLNFIIIAFLVFIIAKFVMKKQKVTKK